MSHRAAGISLMAISAFLFAGHYLATAIFSAGRAMITVGEELCVASGVALVGGICYLIVAEVRDYRDRDKGANPLNG